jgi:GT2 family glycosyltransferase
MKVSVAIVTWNREVKLSRCLHSCLDNDLIGEVIIVDNFSDDNTTSVVESFAEIASFTVKYIKTHENLGCPVARNIALANCTLPYIYCLDDDGWLNKNTLKMASKVLDDNNEIGIVCSKILDPKDESVLGLSGASRFVGKFSAGASLYRTSLFETVGFFPPYFRQMEESHLSLRLLDKKLKIFFCQESIMYHEKSKSTNQTVDEISYNFLHDMNNIRELFGVKFFILLLPYKSFVHSVVYFKNKAFVRLVIDMLKVCFLIIKPINVRKYKLLNYKTFFEQRGLR